MKITQLVETKTKKPYHESVASRLPKGIKTQQQLLNLGYSVAVRDLGLSKAKSLNENFAAKLIDSYHRQLLNEGIGSFLGKAAGHAVGGLGAAWKDAKAGYAAAKGSWDKPAPEATPPAPEATPPAPEATPPAPDELDGIKRNAGLPTSAAGAAGASGGIGDIMKAIAALDPASKKQLAGELDKSINTSPPAPASEKPAAPEAPAAAPEAPAAAPEAPAAAPEAPAAAPEAPAAKPAPNYGSGQTQAPAPSKVNYSGIPKAAPLPQATPTQGAYSVKSAYGQPAPAAAPAAAPAPQFKGPKVNGLQVRNMGEGKKLKFRSNFLGMDL